MIVALDRLVAADAPACAALEQVLFPGDDPWSQRMFRDELTAGHFYLAARVDDPVPAPLGPAAVRPVGPGPAGSGGRLIGYGGIALLAGPPGAEAEIHTVGVHPDHQGEGVGRRLVVALLEHADERRATVFLEVRTDNDAAIGLYRSLGFDQVGLRRNYYRPSGADAYTMRRPPTVG